MKPHEERAKEYFKTKSYPPVYYEDLDTGVEYECWADGEFQYSRTSHKNDILTHYWCYKSQKHHLLNIITI
jgi:hypothetical protein